MSTEIGWLDIEVTNIGLREGNIGKMLTLTFQPFDYSTNYIVSMGPRSPVWQELVMAAFSHTEIITMGLENEDIWDVGLLMFEKRVRGLLASELVWPNYSDYPTGERYFFKHFEPLTVKVT